MIVLDASAAVLGLVDAGDARARMAEGPLSAPHLIDAEVAQALRGLVRRGRVEPPQAAVLLDRWGRLGVRRHPAAGLLPRVWDLRDNLSAYDATYVALAEALGCPVLTADARLAASAGIGCPVLVVRR